MLSLYGYAQLVNEVTRQEIRLGELIQSCLDHVYFRCIDYKEYQCCVLDFETSDHKPIVVSIKIGNIQSNVITESLNSYKKVIDESRLEKILRNPLIWTVPDSNLTSDQYYEIITNIFNNAYEKCTKLVPVSKSRRNDNDSWMSELLQKLMPDRDRARAK